MAVYKDVFAFSGGFFIFQAPELVFFRLFDTFLLRIQTVCGAFSLRIMERIMKKEASWNVRKKAQPHLYKTALFCAVLAIFNSTAENGITKEDYGIYYLPGIFWSFGSHPTVRRSAFELQFPNELYYEHHEWLWELENHINNQIGWEMVIFEFDGDNHCKYEDNFNEVCFNSSKVSKERAGFCQNDTYEFYEYAVNYDEKWGEIHESDIFIKRDFKQGHSIRYILLHEIGHAMGLDHYPRGVMRSTGWERYSNVVDYYAREQIDNLIKVIIDLGGFLEFKPRGRPSYTKMNGAVRVNDKVCEAPCVIKFEVN